MPKRKNLNGLPHNIIKSFFGTERYYNGGYMADWLTNAARQLNIIEVNMDILNSTFEPNELNIRPLTINLKDLKQIVEKELKGNGFPVDFIVKAKVKFKFESLNSKVRIINCFPTLIDIDGHKYETGQIREEALEEFFDAFNKDRINPYKKPLTFFEKLKLFIYTNRLEKQSGS